MHETRQTRVMLTDPYLCALRAASHTPIILTRPRAMSYTPSIYSATTQQATDEEQHSSEPVTWEKLEHETGFDSIVLPQLQGWSLLFTVFSYANSSGSKSPY